MQNPEIDSKLNSKMYLIQIKLENDPKPFRTYVVDEEIRDKFVEMAKSERGFCGVTSILNNGLEALSEYYNNNIAESTDSKKSGKRKRTNSGNELHSDTTKSQSSQSNYFWTDKEKTEFIKLLHIHKKKWTKIAAAMITRDQTQCRSHGQKYLESLKALLDIVTKLYLNSCTPTTDQLSKIKNYEYEQKNIVESVRDANGIIVYEKDKLKFIPSYIYEYFDSQDEERNWRDQLSQIAFAIEEELNYYNSKKGPKPAKQRRKTTDE